MTQEDMGSLMLVKLFGHLPSVVAFSRLVRPDSPRYVLGDGSSPRD